MNNYQPGQQYSQQYGQSAPSGGPLSGLSQKTLIIGAAVLVVAMFIIGSLIGVVSSSMKSDTSSSGTTPDTLVEDEQSSEPDTSGDTPSVDPSGTASEALIIDGIRQEITELDDVSDEEIIRVANLSCASLDESTDIEAVVRTLAENEGYTGREIFYFLIPAVLYDCDQHYEPLMEFLEDPDNQGSIAF